MLSARACLRPKPSKINGANFVARSCGLLAGGWSKGSRGRKRKHQDEEDEEADGDLKQAQLECELQVRARRSTAYMHASMCHTMV